MKNQRKNSVPDKPRVSRQPKALPVQGDGAADHQGQGRNRQQLALPLDPAARRKLAKEVFLHRAGANVLAAQMYALVREDGKQADQLAAAFVEALEDSVRPRDAIEEMLVLQMAWTQARLARLSTIANQQTAANNVRVVNDACDRAANSFRRMMLALAEYRRPPRADGFVAIRHANVANQQVVQHVESRSREVSEPNASNEQGSAPALPALAGRAASIAGRGAGEQAVAAELRPPDGRGQGAVEPERDDARGP